MFFKSNNRFIPLLFAIVIILFSVCAQAQDKRGYTTIYGGCGVFAKFDGTNNKPITGQLFPTPLNVLDYVYVNNAHSCISDSTTGNLLFFCNSVIMYDTSGHIMDNGDSLQPYNIYMHNCCPASGQIIAQGSLILPKGSNNQYYVFTPTITDSMYTYWYTNPFADGRFPYNFLQYHVVDMNFNGGLGKVVQKNIRILENVELSKTGMMACRHANGYDWWLLKQAANTNAVYSFLVTKDTVILDTVQTFPAPVFGYYDLAGQSCFNSDGSKYAFATGGYLSDGAHLFIADFDRCYGLLSNVKEIKIPYDSTLTILDSLWQSYDSLITGISFSPNDSFLYVSRRYNIYQYELEEPDSILAMFHVKQGPDTTFQQFADYGQLQLGIDGRIYIGKKGGIGNSNSVIDFPNLKGNACGFCRKCLRMDTTQWYTQSLANMPDFNMPEKTPCWPLSIPQSDNVSMTQLDVHPNPANTVLYIETSEKGKIKIELYNSIGQLLHSTYKNEIELSGYSHGLYYIKAGNSVKKVIIE